MTLLSGLRGLSLLSTVSETVRQSFSSWVLLVAFLICLLTRVWTGIQSQQQSRSKAGAKGVAVVPYWFPWLGHAVTFFIRSQDFLAAASKNTQDGVFHMVLAGQVHNVVIAPSVTQQVLQQRSSTSSADHTLLVMESVFGESGKLRFLPSILEGKLQQFVHQLNRDPFVSNSASRIVKGVEESVHNLVSFSSSYIDQSSWERAADASVFDTGNEVSAEVNFFALVRHYAGEMGCSILMGQDFVNNNPDVVSDLFMIDAKFVELVAGFPRWMPGMGAAYRARERLAQAVAEQVEAQYAIYEDRDPGYTWGDMSDVSSVMKDRAKEWRQLGVGPELYGTGDLAILWALNTNTPSLIFWLLWYIYQQPQLHSEILKEIAPYVKRRAVKSDLPIREAPRVSIDLDGLRRNCRLLKAAYFETLRLEVGTMSYTSVTQTFTVTESDQDADLYGKSQPQTYTFPEGSLVCLPYRLHSTDERYFKAAKTFNPHRFLANDSDENGIADDKTMDATAMSMGTIRVFGGGSTMCKGRNFAEREVLAVAVAILAVWDVQPVGGVWKNLKRRLGAGVLTPKSDVRVRMRKRELDFDVSHHQEPACHPGRSKGLD